MSFEVFKTRQMTKLLQLRSELNNKYPEKRDRVNYIIDILVSRLQSVSEWNTLTDYLFTAYLACKEFSELCVLTEDKELDKILHEVM